MSGRPWTPADDAQLRMGWGHMQSSTLARKLGRTVAACNTRGWYVLRLGAVRGDALSLTGFVLRTGYHRNVVAKAAALLGLPLTYAPVTCRRPAKRTRIFDAYEVDALLAFFATNGDRPLRGVGAVNGTQGAWGDSPRKPACCVDCGTSSKPYASRGRCWRCYTRARRAA